MVKQASKYYQVHPWKIIEQGFDPQKARVSESIFSLANEFMGVRGFFDEGYSGESLVGTYFNGLYELPNKVPQGGYKGISKKGHFMVNSVNFLASPIYINNQKIDLAKGNFNHFIRTLDMRSGELVRQYIYELSDVTLEITFKRLLDMLNYTNAYQVIEIKVIKGKCDLLIKAQLDYDVKHFGHIKPWKLINYRLSDKGYYALASTKKAKHKLYTSGEILTSRGITQSYKETTQILTVEIKDKLQTNESIIVEKRISHLIDLSVNQANDYQKELEMIANKRLSYQEALLANQQYFQKKWDECDIVIEGDDENLQGIRFCIFNLMQTYRGISANNIGAKGLTGEAYSGHAFWDTETYILPFYLFTSPWDAKKLLMFRYRTLPKARLRARELDCQGACYPIATLNGDEACDLWQHASLQFQPSTGVAYAIWHYVHLTKDYEFLRQYGAEMLLEIARFLASRGDWNSDQTGYGFYGVMGPDEFQLMVNNNTYTNYLAKRTFEYTCEVFDWLKRTAPSEYSKLVNSLNVTNQELSDFQNKASHMIILYDDNTHVFEQHDGFFKLPHVNKNTIAVEEFPLYHHWSYDRLYRNDLIKQPDVLMMMFLYNQSFTKAEKRANYEYYEPKTIHESSLSPSIHSILANELEKYQEAFNFFGFATRLDLDDYNRNTSEGLHVTSLAAAWLNIIYGFGGLRSDGEYLKLAPMIPRKWQRLQFKIQYLERNIEVDITQEDVTVKVKGEKLSIMLYDQFITVESSIKVKIGG